MCSVNKIVDLPAASNPCMTICTHQAIQICLHTRDRCTDERPVIGWAPGERKEVTLGERGGGGGATRYSSGHRGPTRKSLAPHNGWKSILRGRRTVDIANQRTETQRRSEGIEVT